MKRFIIRSTLLAIFFLIAGYLLYTWVIPQWYTPLLIFMLLFYLRHNKHCLRMVVSYTEEK